MILFAVSAKKLKAQIGWVAQPKNINAPNMETFVGRVFRLEESLLRQLEHATNATTRFYSTITTQKEIAGKKLKNKSGTETER